MQTYFEKLIGHSFLKESSEGPGDIVARINGIRFGDITDIESVDWSSYSTCRGHIPKAALAKVVDILLNENATFSDDDQSEAENEGIWDWICHQHTLYTVSPLFLDYALTRCRITGRVIASIADLVSVCRRGGTSQMYLTNREIRINREGSLPIFRIEEVLEKHKWLNT